MTHLIAHIPQYQGEEVNETFDYCTVARGEVYDRRARKSSLPDALDFEWKCQYTVIPQKRYITVNDGGPG